MNARKLDTPTVEGLLSGTGDQFNLDVLLAQQALNAAALKNSAPRVG